MRFGDVIALLTAVLAIFLTGRYCWLISKHRVKPVLAMWIMFVVSVSLSFGTYMSTDKHSFLGNLGNSLDIFDVWLILVFIIIFQVRHQRKPNGVEIGCLAASAVVAFFWLFTGESAAANLLLQLIMVFAYVPAIKELERATEQIESFQVWAATLVSGIGTFVSAALRYDVLGMVYSGRAIISVSLMLYHIWRLDQRVRIAKEA